MADVTINATVEASGGAVRGRGISGEAITAGDPVYMGPTGLLFKGDANATASSEIVGIALNAAPGSGQPVEYAVEDPDFTPGFTMSLSDSADTGVYILSATAGKIAPIDDLGTGMFPVILLIATSTTKARLRVARGSTVLTTG